MDAKTRANREAWNALAENHFKAYHIDKLLAGEPLLSDVIQREVGDVHGKSLMHLLCHIGTDTLSWGLLGAQVSGVDISPESLKAARKLADQMGIPANFIQSDVMDLLGKIETVYDIVFSSTGVLCWIPDIERFAATVRQLLKPGGFFYLHDGHPFRKMLETTENGDERVKNDYFRSGAQESDVLGDYAEPDWKIPVQSYEWDWTLGEIITAFCQNGMRISFLHEYPQYFYSGYTGYDVEMNKRELYPCTFSLKVMAE